MCLPDSFSLDLPAAVRHSPYLGVHTAPKPISGDALDATLAVLETFPVRRGDSFDREGDYFDALVGTTRVPESFEMCHKNLVNTESIMWRTDARMIGRVQEKVGKLLI